VEEAVREKKRKRTVKINWLRVRRLGGYKKKNVFKGVHVYGGCTFTVYTVVAAKPKTHHTGRYLRLNSVRIQ
jgi:hypothetical protein